MRLTRSIVRPVVSPIARRVTDPSSGWSPLALFAAGEKGVWFDPSDLASMNTKYDLSGSVPGIGDPVGYIADKSGNGKHAKQTTDDSRPLLQQENGRYYLDFDGTDDFLVTAAINLTGTDKVTVFLGERTDTAGDGIVAELSAAYYSNVGSFSIRRGFVANSHTVGLCGAGPSAITATCASGTPPFSTVLTATMDIAGALAADELNVRVNGATPSPTRGGASSAGTGNFGNFALYIGRRGGTALPFNGRVYSFIIRGAASTAAQIATVERFVNSKTGAY